MASGGSNTAYLEDGETYRHWSAESEKYGRGDALTSLLDDGWRVRGVVFRQDYWQTDRRIPVYHFKLERDGELTSFAVVQTPFITRLLASLNVQVVLINQRKEFIVDERW